MNSYSPREEDMIDEQKALVVNLHKAILKTALDAYVEYHNASYVHDAGFDSLMAGIQEAIGECIYSGEKRFENSDWYGTDITEEDLK